MTSSIFNQLFYFSYSIVISFWRSRRNKYISISSYLKCLINIRACFENMIWQFGINYDSRKRFNYQIFKRIAPQYKFNKALWLHLKLISKYFYSMIRIISNFLCLIIVERNDVFQTYDSTKNVHFNWYFLLYVALV